MKRLKINHRPHRNDGADTAWKPLLAALRDTVEWALDLAARLASPYPEEHDAVERLRAFLHARHAGLPSELDVDDVLLTLGILIAAIDRPRSDARTARAIDADGGALPDAYRWPAESPVTRLPLVHHCPGAHPSVTHRMPHLFHA